MKVRRSRPVEMRRESGTTREELQRSMERIWKIWMRRLCAALCGCEPTKKMSSAVMYSLPRAVQALPSSISSAQR